MENVYESALEVGERLRGGGLSGCVVEHVDISGRDLGPTTLDHVRFAQSSLNEVTVEGMTAVESHFTGCQLRAIGMARALVRDTNFMTCHAMEARATGGIFERVGFYNTPLSNADFRGVRLNEVTFQSSDLYNAVFDGALLNRCRFTDPNMGAASLNRTSFVRAMFIEVDLRDAILYGANLTDAVFLKCDLRGAVTEGATLDGARFINCQGHATSKES